MAYYHDLITEKSFKYLQELRKKYSFILIGGWAVYLYTKGLKSRDIDFICDYKELEKLKLENDLIKNDRLKKYEIHAGEFDIDIYVPFFSDLGIPVDELQNMTQSLLGFTLLSPEPLLILKQKAYENRANSAKGRKDVIDIVSLLKSGVDIKKYKMLIKKYKLGEYFKNLRDLLLQIRDVPEISMNEHGFSRFKKDILKKMEA